MNLDSLLLEGDDRDEMKDVGSILAKVQSDLRHLREELQAQITRGDVVDIQSLQRTIEHIEERLTDQTEQIVKKKFGNFTTLPIILPQHQPQPQRHVVKHSKALSTPNPIPLVTSPGREAQLQYMSKLLAQPTHPSTRQILNDAFGIPYSVRHSPRKGRQLRKRAMSGGTVNHLTVLPLINRRSALMTPPPISSTDAQYGLLSLLERGLIPKAADIQLHPSPVHHRTAALHSFSTHKLKSFPIDNLEGGGAFVGVKLDINTVITDKKPQLPPIPFNDQCTTSVTKPVIKTLNVPNVTTEHQEDQQLLSIQKQHKDYKIPIRGGLILHNDLEYKEFKTKHKGIWYKVQRILDCVEQMAQNYAIPVVFVSGDKLLELVEEYDLEPNPRNKELLPCILNSKEVEHLLRIPGRRFKGHNGVRVAATKLQATYRMYVQRCQYLEYRRMKWAAGVIAMGWTLHMKVSKVKKLLKEDRENHVINYRERLKILGESWQNYSQQKRVIIHIPSKGYLCHIRKGLPQFSLSQNLQMSRVCDAIDPNVDIVYVCPVEIGDEVKDYYQQLLDMREKNTDIWNRVHFIVPEHLESFGHHRLSLASLLKYSPQALRQIKSIIGDRQAIIVPHVPSHEDLEIADLLDVPLLGAEPSLIRLYSTYSGRQQLFLAAEVTTPPHIKGVYSVEQLIDGLSWLVVNFISVRRWLFKIDHHVHGRGIAYCDVHDHLDCYKWILKERNRYGEKWDKQWAQEHAIKRVLFELPAILARNAIPTDKQAFSTWASFQKEFLASGGSIEAHPPSDSVTSITVDLLLGPDQSYSTLSTWDHIHSGAYQVWGGSMPQTSVEPDVLMSLAEKVAEAALSRGIVGHISVDFVTFIHPDDMSQTIWGVDLDFGPSDYVYMHSLLRTVANLQLDWSSGQSIGSQQRYAIVSTQLKHSNLSLVEYGVFFQMCKAHLIGYNNKTCTGTLFTLIESHHRHNLGMICLQTSLSEALATAADALSAIHQEISTPHMQGSSNFPAVSQSMNEIAQLLQANIDETS